MTRYLLVSVMLLAGCQASDNAGEMKDSMPMIPALSEHAPVAATAWNSDWVAGNAEAIGGQYAMDAIVYPPGGDPVMGSEAITRFWAGVLATAVNGRLESVEADNDGSIGYEVGNYVIEDSTGAHLDHGNYVVVWKYSDGGWKIFRDTWNSNMPEPAM